MTIEATVEETIAAVKRLRKAGQQAADTPENVAESKLMKRKMDAARIIENRRIDSE